MTFDNQELHPTIPEKNGYMNLLLNGRNTQDIPTLGTAI
jgi:hypothetical protein